MDKTVADKVTSDLANLYDLIAVEYDQKRKFVRPEVKAWAEEMGSTIHDPRSTTRVLELGCGGGEHAKLALERGAFYTGLDLSPRMVELARFLVRDERARFAVGEVVDLPFADASFDAVWAVAILHHVPSQEKRAAAFREIARVLKPGGRAYLFNWNLFAWEWLKRYRHFGMLLGLHPTACDRRDVFIPWKSPAHGVLQRYYHAFTLRELEALVKTSGLSLVGQRYISNGQTRGRCTGQSIETIVRKG